MFSGSDSTHACEEVISGSFDACFSTSKRQVELKATVNVMEYALSHMLGQLIVDE
jgi:hypothetical protein